VLLKPYYFWWAPATDIVGIFVFDDCFDFGQSIIPRFWCQLPAPVAHKERCKVCSVFWVSPTHLNMPKAAARRQTDKQLTAFAGGLRQVEPRNRAWQLESGFPRFWVRMLGIVLRSRLALPELTQISGRFMLPFASTSFGASPSHPDFGICVQWVTCECVCASRIASFLLCPR